MLARLEHAHHHLEGEQAAMRAAEQLATNYDLAPRYAGWVKSNLACLWIKQGDLERAFEYVQKCGINTSRMRDLGKSPSGEIPYLHELEYLVSLRLLLAQREYEVALVLSQRLLQRAEETKRAGRTIEVLALQALALQGKKDKARAIDILGRALSLAQPEGYVRVFLDEGESMVKLLYQAKTNRTGNRYASELLSALDETTGPEMPNLQLLIEPLTPREFEVLKLIEDGCSNQEIADTLVISLPTVKRHISNIYAKLGAKSRTQAISLGKELDLFE
jgi:LuxR family maltose regulon positive regulatory protein